MAISKTHLIAFIIASEHGVTFDIHRNSAQEIAELIIANHARITSDDIQQHFSDAMLTARHWVAEADAEKARVYAINTAIIALGGIGAMLIILFLFHAGIIK